MARGFSTTYGIATTDKIVSSLTAHGLQRTYSIWFYFNSGSNNRIFCKQISGGTQIEQFLTDTGGATYRYSRTWSGGNNDFTIVSPSNSVWHHYGITYDGSDVNNAALIYLDGVPATVTQAAGPTTGTISTNTDNYHIGNRGAGDRVANGLHAEFAVWDRILTPQEIGLIYSGFSPLRFPVKLVEYLPLDGSSLQSKVVGRLPAVATGTLVQAHPQRIVGPSRFRPYFLDYDGATFQGVLMQTQGGAMIGRSNRGVYG